MQCKSSNLLGKNIFQLHSRSSECGDAVSQFLDGHLLLVKLELELRLVVDVALALDVKRLSAGRVELGRNGILASVE